MQTERVCPEVDYSERAPIHGWAAAGKVGAFVIAIALAGAIFYALASGADLRGLGALGYPGVFLLAFLSSATVLVPVPGLAFTLGAGAIWHPVIVGIVGGLGAATGELVGYLVGRAGLAALKNKPGGKWRTAECWLRRYGFWAILLIALIPNPFFDAIGLAAGALAYPTTRFWMAAAAGNCVKYVVIATIGSGIAFPFA